MYLSARHREESTTKLRSNFALVRRSNPDCLRADISGLLRFARNDGMLVIIPRHPERAGDVLVARGELDAGAARVLADGVAIEFLPRRLVRRGLEAAIGLQLGVALLHLVVRDQDIRAALVEVDAHLVAVPQNRKAAVRRSFRRGIQDGGRARGAGLPAVADAGQGVDAAFDQRRRRLHVHDLGTAGIADRPGAADEQHAALVDVERGIVDSRVIVLRPLEYDGAALERVEVLRVAEIAVAKLLGD